MPPRYSRLRLEELSGLRISQRGSVDLHRVALVAESTEQRLDERLVAEEVRPLAVVKVGSDDGRLAPIALLHQLEKDVRLLWAQVQVAHLVDDEDIHLGEAIEQSAGGPVRQRRVHLVEELLGAHEDAAVPVLQRLE